MTSEKLRLRLTSARFGLGGIEFLGNSRIDGRPIYKTQEADLVPTDAEILRTLEDYNYNYDKEFIDRSWFIFKLKTKENG